MNQKMKLPIFLESIHAGFPSPADDFAEKKLDLNEYLIKHPAATFFVRVKGHSMKGCGIEEGDLLIVDRAVSPYHGAVIIAFLEGEFTVKRIIFKGKKMYLVAENTFYRPITIKDSLDFQVWGVVIHVIKHIYSG
jgi:DNA polymerase V